MTRSPAPIEANPSLGQLDHRRAGGSFIAVEAQVVGRDGVQHDQEDIGGARAAAAARCAWRHSLIQSPPQSVAARIGTRPATMGKLNRNSRWQAGGMPLQGRDQPRRDPQRHDKPGQTVDPRQANQEGRQQCQRARASEAPASRLGEARPERGVSKRRPTPGRGTGWSAGSATRNGGSSRRGDSDRTSACARRSYRPRAVPRRARTRPTRPAPEIAPLAPERNPRPTSPPYRFPRLARISGSRSQAVP